MKGRPLSSSGALAIILLAAAAAWALWFTNHVVYCYAVWKHRDCYRLTQAIVGSIEYTEAIKGRGGYWAQVTVEGKQERMNLIGFKEFDQSVIRQGTTAQYTGQSVPVYYCGTAPSAVWFTNRGLRLIPASIDINQAGSRSVTGACSAYLPLILLAVLISIMRRKGTVRRRC